LAVHPHQRGDNCIRAVLLSLTNRFTPTSVGTTLPK
jgi:hypothetical protein